MEGFFYGLSSKLLALSVLVQFLEYIYLRSELSESGVWRWSDLRRDYPSSIQSLLSLPFSDRGLPYLLGAGVAAALGLYALPQYPFAVLVFFCCWLMSLRFRGTFNGGSDAMTLTVAGALGVSSVFSQSPLVVKAAFLYVGIQVTLSYFIAGIVKLRNPGWRDGSTLAHLLTQEKYAVPRSTRKLARRRGLMAVTAWTIILFECTFPLALVSLPFLWIYLPLALVFHAANVHVFGLNRFFFAWLAAYPLLYYSCLQLR